MAQRIEFKGVIHEFPDDFTQEQVSAALKNYSANHEPPPIDAGGIVENLMPEQQPEPQHPSNWAVAGETLTRQIPANIFGAPVDIMSIPVEAVRAGYHWLTDTPMGPKPEYVGGSDWFKNHVFQQVADRDQYSGRQRLAGNMMTLGGEALAGGAGLAARAKQVPNAVGFLAEAARPYLSRPGAQIAQDVTAGVGAGGGLTAAEEMDLGPIGTLFATMLGGMSAVPAAKGVEGAVRGRMGKAESDVSGVSRRTLDDVRSLVTEPQIDRSTGQRSGPLVTDRQAALQNIDQSLADANELGLVNPTLGPASGDVGLSMLDVRERLKSPQKFAERDQQIRTGIAQRFGDLLSNPKADVTAPQRSASSLIRRELDTQQQGINRMREAEVAQEGQLSALKDEAQNIPAQVQARRGMEGRASSQLNEQLRPALDERTKLKNDAFEQSAQGAFVEAKSLARLVDEVNAEAPKLAPDARLPSYIMEGIRKFIPQPGTLEGPNSTAGMIPAEEVLSLRKYLDTEIQSLKQKGDWTKADTLQSFKSKINQTIELDPQFAAANQTYKQDYAPYFRSPYGQKYRDTVQRGTGVGQSDAENIAGMFLNSTGNAKADLDRIREIVPNQKSFDDAVEMYFDASLAKKTLNPKTIRNFIADNADVLPAGVKSKYEGIVRSMMDNTEAQNSTLSELNTLKKTIRDAEGEFRKTEQTLASGPLGRMSRFDDDKYIDSIMGANDRKKQIAEIKDRLGDDKEAMDGFKEATVQWLMRKVKGTDASGVSTADTDLAGRPIVYSKLTNTFDQNREALADVFSPEEMNTLQRMHTVMSRQGNLSRRATTGSDTAEKLTQTEKQVMDTLEVALKIKFGMLKGAGLNKVAKQVRNVVFGPSQRVIDAEELLNRMALDPKVAKVVLEIDPLTVDNGKWFSELQAAIGATSAARVDEDDDGDHEYR